MRSTTRLIVMVLVNFIMVAAMLYGLALSGIDLEHTTLLDHAGDGPFIFGFLALLVLSFMVNVGILRVPSQKRALLDKLLATEVARKPARPSHKSHKNSLNNSSKKGG